MDASPLKPELLRGVDLLVVRELTGGIYFGEKRREAGPRPSDALHLHGAARSSAWCASRLASRRARRQRLTSVDKANVLETSRLWREVADAGGARRVPRRAARAPAGRLLRDAADPRPADFDVIVTENMFGDILTDEASVLAGSIGMLPSASLGEGARGLYEPIHGSAPDIAGKGIANPYGTILSVAMLLRHSLGLETEARAVEAAVSARHRARRAHRRPRRARRAASSTARGRQRRPPRLFRVQQRRVADAATIRAQHSRAITEGSDRAPARAMLKAIGFTDEDLAKPASSASPTPGSRRCPATSTSAGWPSR